MKKAVIFDMYGVLIRRNLFINEAENTQMTQIVRELKDRGVVLILLSNIYVWNSAHFKKKFRFLSLFDKLYFSSDTKLIKPDPRAFKLVLEENNLKPEECMYFDDSAGHVAAAQTLGIEKEYVEGHLEGCTHNDIYESSFKEGLEKLDKEKRYVVYCGSGGRSGDSGIGSSVAGNRCGW